MAARSPLAVAGLRAAGSARRAKPRPVTLGSAGRVRRAARALLCVLVGMPAAAATELPREAGPLRPDSAFPRHDPSAAAGALVWLHPSFATGEPPAAPPFAARLMAAGWDLWRFDRTRGRDPVEAGAATLAEGTAALREAGYRRVAVLGESRGAFIALAALERPGLADTLLALAPAAHGTRPERRAQAMAAFLQPLGPAMAAHPVGRAGLVLFADDPYDPDPPARAAAFRTAMKEHGIPALLLLHPPEPRGHGAAAAPEMDARFGACLAAFLDPARDPQPDCGGAYDAADPP